jgi:hypothetical protein
MRVTSLKSVVAGIKQHSLSPCPEHHDAVLEEERNLRLAVLGIPSVVVSSSDEQAAGQALLVQHLGVAPRPLRQPNARRDVGGTSCVCESKR